MGRRFAADMVERTNALAPDLVAITGDLVDGGVRQLAADLRINPNTVRQAYGELERDGVLEVRRGQGTFVAEGGRTRRAREHQRLLSEVADRALRDAFRHGFDARELARAVRERAASKKTTRKTR